MVLFPYLVDKIHISRACSIHLWCEETLSSYQLVYVKVVLIHCYTINSSVKKFLEKHYIILFLFVFLKSFFSCGKKRDLNQMININSKYYYCYIELISIKDKKNIYKLLK
ncbi:hypothetical protein A0H76_2237 [Hepatospora eriocheir]|uniref:Uncharacterized protein n=1 Tax=Hepatospora eriocheir TaxID=1081669 RepID=A0A1X0QFQ2_9MICR|nr:hypothetical protein A0H76_2237 [Hepatospora eriocheir]